LVNLIEEERRRHEERLAEIDSDNRKHFRKGLLSLIGGTAFGAGICGIARDPGIGTYLYASTFPFLAYQLATISLPFIRNPLKAITPRIFLSNWRTYRKTISGDYGAYARQLREHCEEVEKSDRLTREFSAAEIDMHFGEKGSASVTICEILDMALRSKIKPNLFRKAVNLWTWGKRKRFIGSPYFYKLLDAAYYSRWGWDDRAEVCLEDAVRDSKDEGEKLNSLCTYGYFLESRGRLEEAKEVFGRAVREIVDVGGDSFRKIPGTKNEVRVHNSKLVGHTFAFKRGEDNEDLKIEYHGSEFINKMMGIGSGGFIVPIVINLDGDVYTVYRWAGNFTLGDYIEEGLHDDAYGLIGKSLENILLLHLKSKDLPDVTREFGSVDTYALLKNKFLDRLECLDGSSHSGLSKGLRFLVDELESGFTALTHMDYHPGNTVVSKSGNTCVIDMEKAEVGPVYVDPVTLVDNSRCVDVFTDERPREKLFSEYCENALDGGGVDSLERSLRDMHLGGVCRNLHLFGSAVNFSGEDELEEVQRHHIERGLYHLRELEGIYRGNGLRRIREIRKIVEDNIAA